MNFSPWLEFIAVLGGSIFGAYLAVRVELASIKEQIKAQAARFEDHAKAQAARLEDHAKRIERLEGGYFRAD